MSTSSYYEARVEAMRAAAAAGDLPVDHHGVLLHRSSTAEPHIPATRADAGIVNQLLDIGALEVAGTGVICPIRSRT